jgi:hypothetical protein
VNLLSNQRRSAIAAVKMLYGDIQPIGGGIRLSAVIRLAPARLLL